MNEKPDISIMGCGWLGLPLAEQLLRNGFSVKGSTTSVDKLPLLREKGIEPFVIDLSCRTCRPAIEGFLETDVLILSFPPKLRTEPAEAYLNQIRQLHHTLLDSSVSRVLFISSTAVYADLNREITEADALAAEATPENPLLFAEKIISDSEEWLTTVLRFGGLVGPGRHPGKFLAGKKNLPQPEAPVNLIHLDDCVAIMEQIILQQQWGHTYNACTDKHPTRRDFYTRAAQQLQLPPPEFAAPAAAPAFKIINSEKLKADLSYSFRHPDPMLFC